MISNHFFTDFLTFAIGKSIMSGDGCSMMFISSSFNFALMSEEKHDEICQAPLVRSFTSCKMFHYVEELVVYIQDSNRENVFDPIGHETNGLCL